MTPIDTVNKLCIMSKPSHKKAAAGSYPQLRLFLLLTFAENYAKLAGTSRQPASGEGLAALHV